MSDSHSSPLATGDAARDRRDLEAAVVCLGWAAGRPCEPLVAGRAVTEAISAWGNRSGSDWRHVLQEGGESLGLRLRIAELTWGEIQSLARYGSTIVAECPDTRDDAALVVLQSYRRGLRLTQIRQGRTETRKARRRDLRDRSSRLLQCVVQEPIVDDREPHAGLGPSFRLLRLLQPEGRELFVALVLGMCAGLLGLSVPIAAQQLVRAVTFGSLYQPIVVLSVMLLALMGLLGCFQALHVYVAEILQRRLFARTVAELTWRLPRVPPDVWEHHDGPELVNRFLEIVTVQKVVANLVVDGLMLVLTTLIGMSLMAFYHPYLLGYDLFLVAMLIFILAVLGRGGVRTAIEESICKYRILAWIEQLLRSRATFQSIEGREWSWQRADALCGDYLAARSHHFGVLIRQIISMLVLQALATTGLLSLGGYLVLNEQLTLGQLIAAELIVAAIVGSFAKVGKHLEGWYDLMAAMDKLGHLFDLPMEATVGLMLPAEGGPLRVTIREANGAESAVIEPGDTVAIVEREERRRLEWLRHFAGEARSHHVEIELDGMPIDDLRKDALRSRVAVISEPALIEGTLGMNLHLQRSAVTDRQLLEALASVGLHAQIQQLEDRLETTVLPEGSPLAPLEIRKLMLARAMVGRPRLIVLDAWVDLLPREEQQQILAALQSPLRTWTTIVVTTGPMAELCPRRLGQNGSPLTRGTP